MRVTGSQFISTSDRLPVTGLRSSLVMVGMETSLVVPVRGGFVAGVEGGAFAAPLRLVVGAGIGDGAKRADDVAVGRHASRRESRSRRLVHEWHELVREARHGAGDADTADVGTA